MIRLTLVCAAFSYAQEPAPQTIEVPGQTWATAGIEHELFACRDVNDDGFEDLVVLTPQRTLLVSESVKGWKAAPWRVLDVSAWPDGIDGFERVARAEESFQVRPDAPPHNPDLQPRRLLGGDLDGDGRRDAIAIFRCTQPSKFLLLRVAFARHEASDDSDGDGCTDAEERALGSDPHDRDSDDDGLLDGWEVHGLPRAIPIAEGTKLNPLHKDALCVVSPHAGVDVAALPRELAEVARLYAALSCSNPDGSQGVRLHFRIDPPIPAERNFGGDWRQCGEAYFATRERGFYHWMQVTTGGGGQSSETSDMGGAGAGWAVFAHELGHQVGLGHSGDSVPAWCPLYPSLMNYAFSYSLGGDARAIRFSDGRFRAVLLDERRLSEELPFPYAELRYLAAAPFRFLLEAQGADRTRIDWNHNGRFDEGFVSADVNYGGSTHCGIRRDAGPSAAAPALASAAGSVYLAQVHPEQRSIALKRYLGEEQWSEPRIAPDSATNGDPLLIGDEQHGYLLFRRPPHWFVARFDATSIDAPVALAALGNPSELSAGIVAGRVMLVARCDDDRLQVHVLEHDEKGPSTRSVQELELRSQVAPGFAQEPGSNRIAMATALTNPDGAPMCLRVSWLHLVGERLVESETHWVRGVRSGTQCGTRPSVLFDSDGQLNIFHTARPGGDGLMTGWRTRRIGNLALDEGWLTCLLYDIWTSSRRAVAAASGPQGAIYAFRWDADGWTRNGTVLVGHTAFGIDSDPMRDFDDGERIGNYGLVHSILWMRPESEAR